MLSMLLEKLSPRFVCVRAEWDRAAYHHGGGGWCLRDDVGSLMI
jgi:hypothetical protein